MISVVVSDTAYIDDVVRPSTYSLEAVVSDTVAVTDAASRAVFVYFPTRVLTIPEALTQTYEWKTSVITGLDGTEQRIARRTIPRQTFSVRHLADSEETIQNWKYLFASTLLSSGASLPLWAEAEEATATAAGNTITGDFSYMDDSLVAVNLTVMMIHPDGVTHEIKPVASKNATTITITGTWANTYPEGSAVVPIETVWVENNTGYSPSIQNAAIVDVRATSKVNKTLDAEGAAALTLYNSKVLLNKKYQPGGNEIFSKKLEKLDFGHKIAIDSEQVKANIVSGRSYLSRGKPDRQWWKLFLNTVKGSQKSFYTPTYRHDMTVTLQPSASGTTFRVRDDATVAGGWESMSSHLHLALEMADGSTLYKEIDPAGTVDNQDGTHTVSVTTAFPGAPAAQHTITKVSFLELVRLASDAVEIEHFHDHRVVKLPIRTILL
jgi:hypothetical protein